MQHVHVDIIELQQAKLAVERLACAVIPLLGIAQFRRNPQVFALLTFRESRIVQRATHAGLIVVPRRAVDMTVAGFQRTLHYGVTPSSSMRSTPKPICGIRLPSFNVTMGVWKVSMRCPFEGCVSGDYSQPFSCLFQLSRRSPQFGHISWHMPRIASWNSSGRAVA